MNHSEIKDFKRKELIDERHLYAYIRTDMLSDTATAIPILVPGFGGIAITNVSKVDTRLPASFLMTIYKDNIFIHEEDNRGRFNLSTKPYNFNDFRVEEKRSHKRTCYYIVSYKWGGSRVNFNFVSHPKYEEELDAIIDVLPKRDVNSISDNLDKLNGFKWSALDE